MKSPRATSKECHLSLRANWPPICALSVKIRATKLPSRGFPRCRTRMRCCERRASPMRADVLAAIEQLTNQMWPGVPVVPVMSTGATDGLYLRNAGIPTYGISGFFEDIDDTRAHGRDERLGVKQFYEGIEFLYRLVMALSS